jgi:hypothetical protein
MRASPIHALVQWLRQHGRPVDYLLQASGLSQFDLTDPNSIIPILPATDFIRLIQNAEGPDIGWRIVDPEIFSQLGGLGTALLQGPRLRDSLLKAAAVLSRHSTHSHLSVLPEKNSIIIRQFLYFRTQRRIPSHFSAVQRGSNSLSVRHDRCP